MTVTSQDRAHADRVMFAIRTRNKKALAEELAFLREDAIRCTVARLEREFKLVPRKLSRKEVDDE